jgi:hypothetical protein
MFLKNPEHRSKNDVFEKMRWNEHANKLWCSKFLHIYICMYSSGKHPAMFICKPIRNKIGLKFHVNSIPRKSTDLSERRSCGTKLAITCKSAIKQLSQSNPNLRTSRAPHLEHCSLGTYQLSSGPRNPIPQFATKRLIPSSPMGNDLNMC